MAIVFKNGDMFTSDSPYLCHSADQITELIDDDLFFVGCG